MQSAMKATCDKAAITGAEPPMASLAPVERIATGAVWAGVCIVTRKTFAPSRLSANSLSSTLTPRLCVSASTAHSSPGSTPHSRNTSANASIHLASIRSTSMAQRCHTVWASTRFRTARGRPGSDPACTSTLFAPQRCHMVKDCQG